MVPWDRIFDAVGPDVARTIVLGVILAVCWYKRWFVSGPEFDAVRKRLLTERDAERLRAENAEHKVVELLQEQIQTYREEKRTAEIVAARMGRPLQQGARVNDEGIAPSGVRDQDKDWGLDRAP